MSLGDDLRCQADCRQLVMWVPSALSPGGDRGCHLSVAGGAIVIVAVQLDFTFPYVSVAAGKNLVEALKKYSGENRRIEDLWTRFFCISSNITLNQQKLHETGLLWRALRATASLPGVYPPLFDEEGLLVDGGYLDNLPIDVMKNEFHAGKVIGSLVSVSSETKEYTIRGEVFSGWEILLNKLNPFDQNVIHVPRVDTILMRSMNVNDYDRQILQAAKADLCIYLNMNQYGLMDYQHYEKIIQDGYEQAISRLYKFDFKNFQ